MDVDDLLPLIIGLERVLDVHFQNCSVDVKTLGSALRALYAARIANWLIGNLEDSMATTFEREWPTSAPEDWTLPEVADLRAEQARLLSAIARKSPKEAESAMTGMGLFRICRPIEGTLAQLERKTMMIIGRARLVPLTELAVLAIEFDRYGKAIAFVAEAQALQPRACDLHCLHIVQGCVALRAGDVATAVEYLECSLRVCTGGQARAACMSRMPLLMLADRLLHFGRRREVVQFFRRCQAIWSQYSKYLANDLKQIENGRTPSPMRPWQVATLASQMRHLVVVGDLLNDIQWGPNSVRAQDDDLDKLLRDWERLARRVIQGKFPQSSN